MALPQASRWYPPKYQGVVLGIAGAGNMGVVLDSLFVPVLAEAYGWQNVFGFLLIPARYRVCALQPHGPGHAGQARAGHARQLRRRAARCRHLVVHVLYFITFGGFVGLGSALPLYFTSWYHVSGIAAGMMAALVVLAGSMFRPVGGWLADRVGGLRSLQVLFVVVALAYASIAFLPPGPAPTAVAAAKVSGWGILELPGIAWGAVLVFFVGAMALGMGTARCSSLCRCGSATRSA